MIKHGELEYVLCDTCELGMYEPKSGNPDEIVVLSFRVSEEECLKDMCFFIEYIPLKNYIGAAHSTFPDADDYYSVFVELAISDNTFEDAMKVVYQVYKNLGNHSRVNINIYPKGQHTFKLDDLKKLYEEE